MIEEVPVVEAITPQEAKAKFDALIQIEYNNLATKFNNIIEPYYKVSELTFINFQYAFDPNNTDNYLHRYLIDAALAGWIIEVKENRQIFVMPAEEGEEGSLTIL